MTLENIVYACYEEHKKHTSNWQHGKPLGCPFGVACRPLGG